MWSKVFSTPFGDVYVLWACVNDNHPSFTQDDALMMFRDQRDGVSLALEIVRPDFWQALSAKTIYRVEEMTGGKPQAAPKQTTSTPCTVNSTCAQQGSVESESLV